MKQCWLVGVMVVAGVCGAVKADPLQDCPGAQAWAARMEAEAAVAGAPRQLPTDPQRRERLLEMAAQDQAARAALSAVEGEAARERVAHVVAVDAANTRVLRGWYEGKDLPDQSTVGADGMRAVWLLTQHADADPALQEKVLAYYGSLPDRGGIRGSNYAMLVDRVLTGQGRPQRYGSQFTRSVQGVLEMAPVEDAQRLDALRASVGLMPIADYRCVMRRLEQD